jgi:hypothetical protein
MLLKIDPYNTTTTLVNNDESLHKYVSGLCIIGLLQLFIIFGLPCYK